MVRRVGPSVVLALLPASCSYDWSLSLTSPDDAGGDASPLVDAAVVDSSDASPPHDAAPGEASTGSIADAGHTDSSPTDSSLAPDVTPEECQQLLARAKNDLALALVCTPAMPGACAAQAVDWCGCTLYLGDGTSAAYATFVSDVNAFASVGCRSTIFCADACPAAGSGDCIVADATAAQYACFE